ncbi:MAG: carboxymuconolactone decarboxylase family protein [Gordonia paraffinivorans]
MTRIPLPDPQQLGGWAREQFDRFPSNLTRTLLVTADERLAGALPATANALRASSFSPWLREAVILRVAARSGSAYERFHHLGQARVAGWSDEQIDAIERGDDERLPATIGPVLRLTDAVVAGPTVDDATLSAVRTQLADGDLVTLLILIGHYLTVGRLTAVLDVDLDPEPDPWAGEH